MDMHQKVNHSMILKFIVDNFDSDLIERKMEEFSTLSEMYTDLDSLDITLKILERLKNRKVSS